MATISLICLKSLSGYFCNLYTASEAGEFPTYLFDELPPEQRRSFIPKDSKSKWSQLENYRGSLFSIFYLLVYSTRLLLAKTQMASLSITKFADEFGNNYASAAIKLI